MAKWIFPTKSNDSLNFAEVRQRLKRVEEMVAELKQEAAGCTLNIENLNIEQLTIEKLIFHLAKLDIKELSGALNIGNNFGVNIREKKQLADQKKQEIRPQTDKKSGSNNSSGRKNNKTKVKFKFK